MVRSVIFCFLLVTAKASSCTGSGFPEAGAQYEGSFSLLWLKETLNAKVIDIVDAATDSATSGHVDIIGTGLHSIKCSSKLASKSGQDIKVDFGDCLPAAISIQEMKYCSDQDEIHVVSVDHKAFDMKIHIVLERQTLQAVQKSDCTGTGFPVVGAQYEGSFSFLWFSETLRANVIDIDDTGISGHVDVMGNGLHSINCSSKVATMSGQDIVVDFGDCMPAAISIHEMKYCSDQDEIRSVAIDHKAWDMKIHMNLKRVTQGEADLPQRSPSTGSSFPLTGAQKEGTVMVV